LHVRLRSLFVLPFLMTKTTTAALRKRKTNMYEILLSSYKTITKQKQNCDH